MSARQGIGHRAQRTGAYAEDKCTNWMMFDPTHSECERVLRRFARELERAERLLIRALPLRSQSLIMPVTEDEVAEMLAKVPAHFLEGLRAVFLLGGSQKQEKFARSPRFPYGCYGADCIFLNPFPRAQMSELWKTLPKPSVRHEYERAGAVWEKDSAGWRLIFTLESLRNFYLRDVLLHELGHHVDRFAKKNRRSSEAFANWMASEFGYAKS